MDRSVVHMDLDCFFVACEVLKNSSLQNKPILIGGKSDRAVVASCSYEARHFGVRAAMPMRYALQLCPDAIVIKGDMELYSNCSKLVTTVLTETAPALEKASIDEFYIETTGIDHFFGCYQWTQELKQTILRETGLTISFGLSVNKTVSKMATNEGKPNATQEVPATRVRSFLNPLGVGKIPQVGKKTTYTLSRLGIRQIKTLAEMPVEFMERLLGQNGRTIWERAQGIDDRPIVPYSEQKSISAERTFDKDTMDLTFIRSLIIKLTEGLAFELRQAKKLTSLITVRIRYTNFDTHTRQRHIPYTTNDQRLIEVAQELFDQLYERRMLIRLVGVKLSGLVSGYPQIDLFDNSTDSIALNRAMDQVRKKFGKNAIQRASSLDLNHKKRK